MRTSLPHTKIHLLIHQPVADLLDKTSQNLVNRFWPLNKVLLLRRPWKFIRLFLQLRREKYDLAITAHNPDNFSISQGIAGKFCRPKYLVGFNAKDSHYFYDIPVTSSTTKHYAKSMLDLWRCLDNNAQFFWEKLKIPSSAIENIKTEFPELSNGGILIWLGATGKKVLPTEVIKVLYEQSRNLTQLPIYFGCGPADSVLLRQYPDWIGEKTLLWQRELLQTAAFLSLFNIFVSGDTGPLHLAVVIDRPTLGIFIDSNITQYGYQVNNKNLSLWWEGKPEDHQLLKAYLTKLLRTAEHKNKQSLSTKNVQ